MKEFISTQKEKIAAAVLWLIVFIVYHQTLAQTVGFIDSGELATVAITLGIAHPTGYPLFTLIGRIFSSLPIAPEEIVRLNIFASLCVSGGIVLFFFFLVEFLGNGKTTNSVLIASAFSSLTLAFSQTVWSQAVSVEVYALHIVFISSILFLFATAIRTDEPRWWLLFAFVVGLSFTNHLTTLLLAPALLYWYFNEHGFNNNSFKKILRLTIPFAAGFSMYLYLPIRAAQHPLLNWGNPQTLEKLTWHISGKQFRVWMFSSSDVAIKQLNYFFEQLPKEFFYLPLFFALIGVVVLLFSDRKKFFIVLLLFTGCVAYSINYDIHDIDAYFLLAFFAVAISASVGVLKIIHQFPSAVPTQLFAAVLLFILAVQIYSNWYEADQSHNSLVEDYTKTILTNLPPHSIVLSYQWDYFVAASYYVQHVKHLRQDVIILDKELFRRSWYFQQLRKQYPTLMQKSRHETDLFLKELNKFEHDMPYQFEAIEGRYTALLKSFVEKNIDSIPVYVTPEIEPQYSAGYIRVPEIYLFRLTKDTSYMPARFPEIYFHQYSKKDKYSANIVQLAINALQRRGMYESRYGQDSLAQLYFLKSAELTGSKFLPR
jgi:hypothetical protein